MSLLKKFAELLLAIDGGKVSEKHASEAIDEVIEKPKYILSERDEAMVKMMEDSLKVGGGAILIKIDHEPGYEAMRLPSASAARVAIEKIKKGELVLA